MSDCEMFGIGIVNGNTSGSFDGIDPAKWRHPDERDLRKNAEKKPSAGKAAVKNRLYVPLLPPMPSVCQTQQKICTFFFKKLLTSDRAVTIISVTARSLFSSDKAERKRMQKLRAALPPHIGTARRMRCRHSAPAHTRRFVFRTGQCGHQKRRSEVIIMICPKCGKEMRNGYLFGSKDGAFSFANEVPGTLENAKNADGFVKITGLGAGRRTSTAACCCDECRIIIIQY